MWRSAVIAFLLSACLAMGQRNIPQGSGLATAIGSKKKTDGHSCSVMGGHDKSRLVHCRISFDQKDYPFDVLQPTSYDRSRGLAAILLMHGSGGNGMELISEWGELADNNEVFLVAPTLPAGPEIEPKIANFLQQLMDGVQSEWRVDARRIYLFGHSAGGVMGFDAAMLDSTYFAAAAVHAAVIDPDYDWIIQKAQRHIPIAIYIGDRDQFFSLARARRTRDVLTAAGFTLHYVEMPRHDHNYFAVSSKVNRDAWKFLSQYSLPGK
jgi:predicted esterase